MEYAAMNYFYTSDLLSGETLYCANHCSYNASIVEGFSFSSESFMYTQSHMLP